MYEYPSIMKMSKPVSFGAKKIEEEPQMKKDCSPWPWPWRAAWALPFRCPRRARKGWRWTRLGASKSPWTGSCGWRLAAITVASGIMSSRKGWAGQPPSSRSMWWRTAPPSPWRPCRAGSTPTPASWRPRRI